MTRNTSISLGDHFSSFVDRQLAHGRYGSASEVVRAGLRLLEEHEIKLAAVRAALIEGEQSGPSQPFDFDRFLEGKRARHLECSDCGLPRPERNGARAFSG